MWCSEIDVACLPRCSPRGLDFELLFMLCFSLLPAPYIVTFFSSLFTPFSIYLCLKDPMPSHCGESIYFLAHGVHDWGLESTPVISRKYVRPVKSCFISMAVFMLQCLIVLIGTELAVWQLHKKVHNFCKIKNPSGRVQ